MRINMDNDGERRLTTKSNRLRLRCFNFNSGATPSFGIKTFVRGWHQLQVVGIGYQALANTANHMTIGSEVPTGEHLFQLINGGVELLNQSLEFLMIHTLVPNHLLALNPKSFMIAEWLNIQMITVFFHHGISNLLKRLIFIMWNREEIDQV